MVKVENIVNALGKKVNNQYVIKTDNEIIFQSYDSTIAKIDYSTGTIYIGKDYNYSVTTSKYRNMFFDTYFKPLATTKALEQAIKEGVVVGDFGRWEVKFVNNLS